MRYILHFIGNRKYSLRKHFQPGHSINRSGLLLRLLHNLPDDLLKLRQALGCIEVFCDCRKIRVLL